MNSRGKIESCNLIPPLEFNGEFFIRVSIEIDHINFGLNPNTKRLNRKKRSNFSCTQIISFLRRLQGEYLEPKTSIGGLSYFVVELYSHLRDPSSQGKLFRLIFTTNSSKQLIGIITLFRIREKKNE